MNKLFTIIFFILVSLNRLTAQDDGPPPPPPPIIKVQLPSPSPTPVPIVSPQTNLPTVAPTQPPVQSAQPLINSIPSAQPSNVEPATQPAPVPLPTLPPPVQPIPVRLYLQGEFPQGPRLRPMNVMREGRKGSWLVGKFILLDRQDDQHYTIESHVDTIGINLVDAATRLGAGRPIKVHLTVVQPPPDGMPQEFQYMGGTPLKITEIDRVNNEVWAIDLTRRR